MVVALGPKQTVEKFAPHALTVHTLMARGPLRVDPADPRGPLRADLARA